MKRDKVIEAIKELPKEFEIEELIDRLIFVEKVELGLAQLEDGKLLTHESVIEIVQKW